MIYQIIPLHESSSFWTGYQRIKHQSDITAFFRLEGWP